MGCFRDYYFTVSDPGCGPACSLDAAAELAGCVRKKIIGSGPLYHPVESAKAFSESERKQALDLAKRTKDLGNIDDLVTRHKETLLLLDDLHDFAVASLVARGPVHKGGPKTPVE
jgi:hypothetical protein